MNSKIYLFALALAAGTVVSACGDIERGKPTPPKKTETADTGGDQPGNDDQTPGGVTEPTDGGTAGGSSFATDVEPILVADCQSCHGATNGTALKISGDAATDLPGVKALAAGGADSTLVKKATKAVSHGGGAVLANPSADLDTILQWIADGMLP
jgi:hypothetical protein